MTKNEPFSITGLLLSLLSLCIGLIAFFGNRTLTSDESNISDIQKVATANADRLAKDDISITNSEKAIQYFYGIADERGKRLATVEADVKNLVERVARLEGHEDTRRK